LKAVGCKIRRLHRIDVKVDYADGHGGSQPEADIHQLSILGVGNSYETGPIQSPVLDRDRRF
uniref:hypothetical protein n=1 Tax=Achromobacter insuavis TaxID=1287735 RepID=UPI001F133401